MQHCIELQRLMLALHTLVIQSSHQIEHLQEHTNDKTQAVLCVQQLAGVFVCEVTACSALRETNCTAFTGLK
jgi:hypothetical protein